MSFTEQQIDQLLKPIHPSRVVKDPKGMQYVEQHDIRAHMNRVFGFGNWGQDVTRLELVFEEPTKILDKQTGKPKPDRWDVCYSASVKLEVSSEHVNAAGQTYLRACSYEDAATGFAQNQTRGESHDLALKSAVSTALKRAATSLGDQFGLSLYAGTTSAIVKGVIGREKPAETDASNVTQLPNNAEGRGKFVALCAEVNLALEEAGRLFEQRFHKSYKTASNEDLESFVNMVRGGLIPLDPDQA